MWCLRLQFQFQCGRGQHLPPRIKTCRAPLYSACKAGGEGDRTQSFSLSVCDSRVRVTGVSSPALGSTGLNWTQTGLEQSSGLKMKMFYISTLLLISFATLDARPQTSGLVQKCKSGPMDLVFIIDSSRSVRPFEFETMRKFMIDIINPLEVGLSNTRVGVVQYSSQVQNVFSLKTFSNKSDMEKAINEIIPLAQGTMTGLAIQYAMNVAFTEEEGARPLSKNIPRVAIIVTDGRPQDRVTEVAAQARDTGIEIYAVGVQRADVSSLRTMASHPLDDHVFHVESFDLIQHLSIQFQDKLSCVDMCTEMDHGCQHKCVNIPSSYYCECNEGYKLNADGKTCSLIDLCAQGNHGCEQICVSSPGSYSCACRAGYQLNEDKKTCSLIDLCSQGDHGCEQICVSSPGSYSCACRAGYQLNEDKKTCSMIDYCSYGNHSCQHECVSILNGYYCRCNEGYTLQADGKTCLADDMCNVVDHGCEFKCVSTPGSYYCICPEGQELQADGKTCNKCSTGYVDLVLVIDGSKSVRPQNFELVKEFVINIVDSLAISAQGTHIGLVQYSSRVRTEFSLDQYKNAQDIKTAVKNVQYMEKGTMTGLALKHMVEQSFSEAEGARKNVPKIGLVFTDGRSQDDISEWAKKAKEAGITMYAVGVGKAVEDELNEIASEPVNKHSFYTADFSTMNLIAEDLKLNICPEEIKGTTETKNPCDCEHLVSFQTSTITKLESLSEQLAQLNARLDDLENELVSKK
ncbi:matrilin-4 isoform X2 [Xenopus laevis]|uniref:Matrilin-4 isoform X2 n=1 Tax=Xenopus laevis TaxID=8355 RepID=A0A8J0TRJ1_XENLA|nr:matrilin-4 isoform X2 [Xenopus laevis]